MNLVKHLLRQREFSFKVFGPITFKDHRGPLDHLRKELIEVEDNPSDVVEWADVILLACDGAMRAGHHPEVIAKALDFKLTVNEHRNWPDWRGTDPTKAIEHVRKDDEIKNN